MTIADTVASLPSSLTLPPASSSSCHCDFSKCDLASPSPSPSSSTPSLLPSSFAPTTSPSSHSSSTHTILSPSQLLSLPKVELHLHLEGAIPIDTFLHLIHQRGHDTGSEEDRNMTKEDLQRRLQYKDFGSFISSFGWMCNYLRTYSDFETLSYDVLRSLAAQNVIYAELFFSPGHFEPNGLKVLPIAQAILRGASRAKDETGIEYNFIADLIRHIDPAQGMRWVEELAPLAGKGVIGVGLGGNETDYPPTLFQAAYEHARSKGFHCTAHAGEAAGPESVWGAIRDLKVSRIGHGVRCMEDPSLVEHLRDTQLHLEVCPTSNVCTGVVASIEDHPVRRMFDLGLNISVNSDDPTFFNCDMMSEMAVLNRVHRFSFDELKQLSLNAARASYLTPADKEKFSEKIESVLLQD